MKRRPLLTLLALTVLSAACSSPSNPSTTTSTGTGGAGGGTGTGGAGGGSTSTGTGTTTTSDPRFDALIAAIEAERADLGAPGVAVAVIEDGKVSFARGFGSKSPSIDDPVAATTLFRTGSVNKMLTATAVLAQVAKGKVDVSHPVTEYVPGFKLTKDASWAPSIHVQHLLAQTSGLYDYLEIDVPASQKTDAALATFMTGKFGTIDYLMVPSGTFWNYSNPNYMLAGLVAETVAGKPYRQVMKEEVFAPLGMDRTFFLGSEVIADGDYALGVTSYPALTNPVKPDSYDNAWGRPAGYATSSVLDLAKFASFLLDGNEAVLPKALSDEMQSPLVDTAQLLDLISYGDGLMILKGVFLGNKDEFYSMKVVQHGGDIPGFAADLTIIPSLHFGFVSMANADGAHFTHSLVTAIRTLNTLPAPSAPPDLTVDPATFGAYEGSYQDDFNVGQILISKVGDELHVSMPAVDQANIPYSPVLQPFVGHGFLMSVQGTQLPVDFLPDESGAIRYLRTRVFVGIKPMLPPPPSPVMSQARRAAFLDALRRSRPSVAEKLTRPGVK